MSLPGSSIRLIGRSNRGRAPFRGVVPRRVALLVATGALTFACADAGEDSTRFGDDGSSLDQAGASSGGLAGAEDGTGGGYASGSGASTATGGSGGQVALPGQSLLLEEGAEGACLGAGAIESDHAGFTGEGYFNGSNEQGAEALYQVESDGASVRVTFRYTTPDARPATLWLGESELTELAFAGTGAWDSWAEESWEGELGAGVHSLRVQAQTAQGLPNLDSLSLQGGTLAAVACPEVEPPDGPDLNQLVGFATLNGGTSGGAGGDTVTVSNYADLKSYAESATPYVILIDGRIDNGSAGGQVNVNSNKTLLGVGSSGYLDGVGLNISSKNNIIVQNLRLSLTGVSNPGGVNGGDVISIHGSSKNIWVDHCELFSEDPAVQTDINKYDGLIDIKGQTGFITLSWNYLHDHHKGGLVGAADDDLYADRKVTMHHNFYQDVRLRVPMYRGSTGHFFNNYIVGARDATEIRAGTCVRVERNYYEALHYSIYTPSDSPGSTERISNIEVDRTSRAYPSNCTADIPYDYSAVLTSSTEDVKTVVPAYAGVGKI